MILANFDYRYWILGWVDIGTTMSGGLRNVYLYFLKILTNSYVLKMRIRLRFQQFCNVLTASSIKPVHDCFTAKKSAKIKHFPFYTL